jgi:sec-independent protein translocase protein TatB
MYAKKLGEFVRSIKRMTDGAKDRLRDEMGPEFDEVDWKQLDPRQYDPRRIIRDALVEDEREARLAARRERASEAAARRAAVAEAAGSGDAAAAVGDAATAVADGPAQAPRVRFDEEAT